MSRLLRSAEALSVLLVTDFHSRFPQRSVKKSAELASPWEDLSTRYPSSCGRSKLRVDFRMKITKKPKRKREETDVIAFENMKKMLYIFEFGLWFGTKEFDVLSIKARRDVMIMHFMSCAYF